MRATLKILKTFVQFLRNLAEEEEEGRCWVQMVESALPLVEHQSLSCYEEEEEEEARRVRFMDMLRRWILLSLL